MRSQPKTLLGLLAALGFLFLSFTVSAQEETAATPVEIPENLTQEEVRDLVARLSDDQVRELIINQLDKVAAEKKQSNQLNYGEQLKEGLKVMTL